MRPQTVRPDGRLLAMPAARATTPTSPAEALELDPHRWQALPVILVATFMGLFDLFVVNVAAPHIQAGLHSSATELQLVVGGYAFTYAAFLITGGRLGDRNTYRRVYIVGMALFTLASAACGVAQTPIELIVARLVQGAGAALMLPQVLALITALFPPAERPRALAWFGAAGGLGIVGGQIGGGALVQLNLFGWDWRTIFAINVPIGIVTIVYAARLLPRNRSAAAPQLDMTGVGAVTATLALALIPLTLGRSEGWPWWMIALLCATPLAAALAGRYESLLARRGGQPVLDLTLFGARSFSAGLAVNACIYAYYGSFMLGFTLFLQRGLGLSALSAGMIFGPLGIAFIASSLAARALIARNGALVVRAGLCITVVGIAALLLDIHLARGSTDFIRVLPVMLVLGVGNGLMLPAVVGASLADVAPPKAGAASGALITAQQFAGATGVAILSEIYFATLGAHQSLSSYLSAEQLVLVLDAALLSVGAATSWLLPPSRRS
ncbi:MAG TPA: MFS transporter [Solirubrobacteraceae bacterium]|nr:MFS transporter [Solirubrobacteraceae bacterium]